MSIPLPEVRSGLPVPAAQFAAQFREVLPHSEALLDAREAAAAFDEEYLAALASRAASHDETQCLLAEIARLRVIEADRITLLEGYAYQEASQWDPDLKYPLRRIDDDAYLPWSGSGDSPAGYGLMTRAQALTRGWLARHVDTADTRASERKSDIVYNRAGPGEKCLTRDALKEAYASREAHGEFLLTPDKVQPLTTSEPAIKNAAGEWEHQPTYWVPWSPDEVPDTLPDGWRDRY